VKTIGKGIKAVIGFKKGGGSEIQSLLFPKSKYNLAQARAWVKEHKYKVHESYLIKEFIITESYLDFDEVEITPEMEKELLGEVEVPHVEEKKSLADLPKEKLVKLHE
jgi:hypothetical protein